MCVVMKDEENVINWRWILLISFGAMVVILAPLFIVWFFLALPFPYNIVMIIGVFVFLRVLSSYLRFRSRGTKKN